MRSDWPRASSAQPRYQSVPPLAGQQQDRETGRRSGRWRQVANSASICVSLQAPIRGQAQLAKRSSGGLGQRRADPRTVAAPARLRGTASPSTRPACTPPAMMIAIDAVSDIAIALPRGRQHRGRCCEGCDAAPCGSAGRTVLLSFGRVEHLGEHRVSPWAGLAVCRRRAVPWPSSLARGPYGWAQVATFLITGLLIVILAVAVRDRLPRRRASSFAVVLLALLGGGADLGCVSS
jgi:hypothetical protein